MFTKWPTKFILTDNKSHTFYTNTCCLFTGKILLENEPQEPQNLEEMLRKSPVSMPEVQFLKMLVFI